MQIRRTTATTGIGLATTILAAGILTAGCASRETEGNGKPVAATASAHQDAKSSSVDEAGKSSKQILADAKRVALAAESVHLAGDVGNGVSLDLVLTNAGQAKGTLTQAGRVQQIVVLNPTTVFAATSKTGGRYVRLPQANAAEVSKSFNMSRLLADGLTPDGPVAKAGVTSQGGHHLIGLKDTSDGSVLYVADSAAAPYPLRIAQSTGGAVTFNDWNKKVTVQVPGATT